ncbi:inositol-3-phosphate synthase [Streptomyces pseudovenezuelae]|uniref:Myo-inositol-1-phosphate synthase n=1 Tax=Streptomyces pseudovenezuelae TaxID=67350 RepID=A0ABT6LA58_9ACTN|nr:inositol-3-phosphate synthase [Streptomyces pseudovenezuelae]MDH6213203.1 myo-inositol-1-phosphate synthase [Streptomyces pseudovenezuelae]
MSASVSVSDSVSSPLVGVWLIGARGSVATTVVAGCAAMTAGLHPPTGLVTETPAFADSGLPPLASLVFGGHDTVDCPLPKRAEALAAGGVLPPGLPTAVAAELAAADREIRPGGPATGDTRTEQELIEAFAADIEDFVQRRGLARTVVVNVASTEPSAVGRALPPSSLYAAAALRAGCPYANFTPSTGLHHPALAESAEASGLPYAGRDGKTGQTLLRSVLGPMFTQRALTVRAWSGANLLGGGDGAALADPAAAAAKNAGKERVLADTLGTTPEGEVHIDDVPALGDWKTAWDHIAFDGFLGTRMILQTIWQGCDSALAAPLVLDLARLTVRAQEAGLSGPLGELGFFFKDPVGEGPAGLGEQYEALVGFAGRLKGTERGAGDVVGGRAEDEGQLRHEKGSSGAGSSGELW